MLAASRTLCRSLFLRGVRPISTSSCVNVQVGDKLPAVDLYEGNPGTKVNTSELKGKVVIFGVPGAFTPTCNNDHAPGFIQNADSLKAKGVSSIVCLSVNDPFVMEAWADTLRAGQKVRFLADTCGDFVKKADLAIDLSAVLGNVRSKRFVLVAEDGVVKQIRVEPDGIGLSCSKAQEVMSLL
ncbi:hypothetical protein ACOMHN_018406 [Nucella lapillus]